MAGEPIQVKNLAKLSKALRQVDKEAPKGLRLAGNAAAEVLVNATRPLIPRRTGKAAASLRAQSTRTSARVAVGGRKAAYYPWLDFGGQGRRRHRPPPRQFIKGGRYIYPTLDAKRDVISKVLDDALVGVIRDAGLEVD